MPAMFRLMTITWILLLPLQALIAGSACSRSLQIELPSREEPGTHFLSILNPLDNGCRVACISMRNKLLISMEVMPRQGVTLSLVAKPKFCVFSWQSSHQMQRRQVTFGNIDWHDTKNLVLIENEQVKATDDLIQEQKSIEKFDTRDYSTYKEMSRVKYGLQNTSQAK